MLISNASSFDDSSGCIRQRLYFQQVHGHIAGARVLRRQRLQRHGSELFFRPAIERNKKKLAHCSASQRFNTALYFSGFVARRKERRPCKSPQEERCWQEPMRASLRNQLYALGGTARPNPSGGLVSSRGLYRYPQKTRSGRHAPGVNRMRLRAGRRRRPRFARSFSFPSSAPRSF